MTTHAGEMLHQSHAGELEVGFPCLPVRQAPLQRRKLINTLPVDPIPGGLLDPAAALLEIADGTQAEMGLGFGQAMPAVGINPFAEGLSWIGLQPFELLKGFEQIHADLDQPVAAGGLGIVRAGVGGGDAEMAFKGRQPRFEGDPVGVPPAVVNADGQHLQRPLVVGFLQILSGPERQLGHSRLQGRHLAGEVVGGSFRCHHQRVAPLGQSPAGLGQRWAIQAAAVDGDAATALQQPADHRASPDRNAAVVEKPQLDGSWQLQLEPPCGPGNAVPEQIRHHHRITGAGVPKGDQQIAGPRLLGCKGLGQGFCCITVAQLKALTAEEQRKQAADHGLNHPAGTGGQPAQCGTSVLGGGAGHRTDCSAPILIRWSFCWNPSVTPSW